MRNLASLLERITKSLGKNVVHKEVVLSCLRKIGMEMSEEDILIKGGTLEIHSTPGKKNFIKMKEAQLLRELKECGLYINRIFYK